MNKYTYTVGSCALALAMGVLPAITLAESQSMSSGDDAGIQTASLVQEEEGTSMSVSARVGDEDTQKQEMSQGSQRQQVRAVVDEESSVDEDQSIDEEDDFNFDFDDDEDRAISLDDLEQRIENRRQKLEDEEASTTLEFRGAMKGANGMRVAVHALLAAQDLIGGIGQQVSEIAKEVDRSVASTTNAEARIQSRGFLSRFFFGGDTASAEVISQEVAQNQQRIDNLTSLFAATNVETNIQVTLQAHIKALQDAQARLEELAQKEQKSWGLFSWRF